jgi:hypothetical protein
MICLYHSNHLDDSLKVVPFPFVKQPSIRQDRPVDQASSNHGHPARCRFDEFGVGEQQGFSKSGDDEHAGDKMSEIGVRAMCKASSHKPKYLK